MAMRAVHLLHCVSAPLFRQIKNRQLKNVNIGHNVQEETISRKDGITELQKSTDKEKELEKKIGNLKKYIDEQYKTMQKAQDMASGYQQEVGELKRKNEILQNRLRKALEAQCIACKNKGFTEEADPDSADGQSGQNLERSRSIEGHTSSSTKAVVKDRIKFGSRLTDVVRNDVSTSQRAETDFIDVDENESGEEYSDQEMEKTTALPPLHADFDYVDEDELKDEFSNQDMENTTTLPPLHMTPNKHTTVGKRTTAKVLNKESLPFDCGASLEGNRSASQVVDYHGTRSQEALINNIGQKVDFVDEDENNPEDEYSDQETEQTALISPSQNAKDRHTTVGKHTGAKVLNKESLPFDCGSSLEVDVVDEDENKPEDEYSDQEMEQTALLPPLHMTRVQHTSVGKRTDPKVPNKESLPFDCGSLEVQSERRMKRQAELTIDKTQMDNKKLKRQDEGYTNCTDTARKNCDVKKGADAKLALVEWTHGNLYLGKLMKDGKSLMYCKSSIGQLQHKKETYNWKPSDASFLLNKGDIQKINSNFVICFFSAPVSQNKIVKDETDIENLKQKIEMYIAL